MLINEAADAVFEGCTVEDIDTAMTKGKTIQKALKWQTNGEHQRSLTLLILFNNIMEMAVIESVNFKRNGRSGRSFTTKPILYG